MTAIARGRVIKVNGKPRRLIWEPFPGMQRLAWDATAFDVLIGGAKGAAKTDLIVNKPLKFTHHPRFKGLVLRATYGEVHRTVKRLLPGAMFRRTAFFRYTLVWRKP